MLPPQNSNLKPSMERVDPDEQLIATIYRHPFGLVAIYVQVFLGLIAASSLLFYILPNFVDRTENPDTYTLLAVVLLVVGVIMVLILLAFTIIYHRSKLMISSKSITQITQIGLFNRKVSQLAISNIEDATAVRKGLFQTILNYGTLNIETAGETENFYFNYCPDPDKYAKTVLEMREHFLSNREIDRNQSGASYASQQYRYQSQQNYQQGQSYPAPQGYPEPGYMPSAKQSYPPRSQSQPNGYPNQNQQYDKRTLPPTQDPYTDDNNSGNGPFNV